MTKFPALEGIRTQVWAYLKEMFQDHTMLR